MESFAVSRTPASRRAAGAQTFTLYSDFPGAESKLLPPEANIQLRLPDSGSFELVPYHCTREPPRSGGGIYHYRFRVPAREVSPQNFCRRRPTPRSKFQAASPPQDPPRSTKYESLLHLLALALCFACFAARGRRFVPTSRLRQYPLVAPVQNPFAQVAGSDSLLRRFSAALQRYGRFRINTFRPNFIIIILTTPPIIQMLPPNVT
ncbi:hypothetical protein C8R43DRAFT_1105153 [Mycena crocata]|nr:hypothetical protein C8R43DRAFT_1105153 [Mycena crocata]